MFGALQETIGQNNKHTCLAVQPHRGGKEDIGLSEYKVYSANWSKSGLMMRTEAIIMYTPYNVQLCA